MIVSNVDGIVLSIVVNTAEKVVFGGNDASTMFS